MDKNPRRKKSILDLTIVTKDLAERTKLKIDENQFTIESSRAETDHKMSVVDINFEKTKRKEKWRTITTYEERKWPKYVESLKKQIEEKPITSYKEITACLNKAASKVRRTRKVKVQQNSKILGYNKEIKDTINQRRKACEKWKKEKDQNRKGELKKRYEELKEKVQDLIDKTEGEEIKNMIDKRGKERIDFWKLIRKLKKKEQGT